MLYKSSAEPCGGLIQQCGSGTWDLYNMCYRLFLETNLMNPIKVTMNSPVVLGFVFISFVVMMLNFITRGKSNELLFMTYRSSLRSLLTYVRLFTHVLGHNGWGHYIGNMSYILLLGPGLEEKYGARMLILVIVCTALITGVVNNVFFPGIALCGASGVVFAFILLTSFMSVRAGELPLTVILVAVIYIGQQVYEGLFVADDISNLSHILGGIVGAVFGFILNI